MDNKKMVCTNCGFIGVPDRITKGSIGVEILLWICFLFPGIIYSLWRLSTRYDGCPKCKASNLIPVDSPIGKKLSEGTNLEPPIAPLSNPKSSSIKNFILTLSGCLLFILLLGALCNHLSNNTSSTQTASPTENPDTANKNLKVWESKVMNKDRSVSDWSYNIINPNNINNYKYPILYFTGNANGLNKTQSVAKAQKINKDIFNIMHPAFPSLVIDVDLFNENKNKFIAGYIWHPEHGFQPRLKQGDAFYK